MCSFYQQLASLSTIRKDVHTESLSSRAIAAYDRRKSFHTAKSLTGGGPARLKSLFLRGDTETRLVFFAEKSVKNQFMGNGLLTSTARAARGGPSQGTVLGSRVWSLSMVAGVEAL